MPAIDELVAMVAAALDRVQAAATRLRGSRRIADELAGEYRGLGSDDRVRDVTAIGAALEEQQARATAAVDHGEAVLARVEALRGGDDASGGGPPPAAPLPPAVVSGPGEPVPPFVLELTDRLPDREPGGRTRLFAYSHDDGVATEFASGRDRTAREGLKPEYACRFVVRDHAEGHVAAVMRRPDGPREVTVVVNNEPCSGPRGCDATLPDVIPEGATINVYVKGNGQTSAYAAYRGTGEGIA